MSQPDSLLQTILAQLNDGVYFVDPDRRITFWNRAAERITGYSSSHVLNQFCMANILMHVNDAGEQLCLGACPLAHTLKDGQDRETEVYLHHADGHRVPVAVRVTPIREGTNGEITGAVEVFTENVTLSTALARIAELQRETLLDPLLCIGNRRMIQARLELVSKEWERHSVPFGVLMIDVDHFKGINDTYGHEVGDRVLRMVTRSLSSGLRSYDSIGRWGGEEYLAILVNVDPAEFKIAADRLRMLVETSLIFLDEENRHLDKAVRVTVSMGGALVRSGEPLDELVSRADQNLYHSKQNGRNCVTIENKGG